MLRLMVLLAVEQGKYVAISSVGASPTMNVAVLLMVLLRPDHGLCVGFGAELS
jgi:hypothetical protein